LSLLICFTRPGQHRRRFEYVHGRAQGDFSDLERGDAGFARDSGRAWTRYQHPRWLRGFRLCISSSHLGPYLTQSFRPLKAIALAVLHDLVSRIGCLGLFTTHHAMLTSEFASSPLVRRCFMSYVNNDDDRTVSFLYRMVEGVSPKSYGMNVASMAGVPVSIVDVADAVAKEFEMQQRDRQGRAQQERSALPLPTLADFAALFRKVPGSRPGLDVALRWANVTGALAASSR